MSAETKKVLEMLAEGKITSDDAEKLLDKLAAGKSPDEASVGNGNGNGNSAGAKSSPPPAATFKFLRVRMGSGEGHDVNVKVPLGFVRAGVKLLGVLPPRVAQKLNDKGVNLDFLSQLKGDELDEALNELHVDVETDEGQHVQVFCE